MGDKDNFLIRFDYKRQCGDCGTWTDAATILCPQCRRMTGKDKVYRFPNRQQGEILTDTVGRRYIVGSNYSLKRHPQEITGE